MKKITENQLIERANRLKEIVAEMGQGPGRPGQPAAAAPAGTTKVWPTTPQAIKAFQTANKLTVDGLIGARTYTALTQQGYKPPAGFTVTAYKPTGSAAAAPSGTTKPPAKPPAAPLTQTQQNMAAAGMAGQEMRTPAEIAASADLSSANNAGNINAGLTPDDPRWQGPKPPAPAPAAAAPATGMQAVGDDAGNTTVTRPDGSSMVVGPDGKQIMPGSNPNLPQNKGVINTIKNAVTGQGDFQKPTGFIPGQAPTQESVGFQNDELTRLVTLVHHR
jgi:peptidoglycan hydrolase-like protein with peptidoglycan-binding domain